uniref:Vesicle transport protein n=1 Tax=Phasianus colchicus TaxID=9054 RepID=A0A669QSA1_PHACC
SVLGAVHLSGTQTLEKSQGRVIDATSLGWGTRVKGFIACFALGCVFSVLGSCLLWVPRKGLILFAAFYTLGNIASIGRIIILLCLLPLITAPCVCELS